MWSTPNSNWNRDNDDEAVDLGAATLSSEPPVIIAMASSMIFSIKTSIWFGISKLAVFYQRNITQIPIIIPIKSC